MAWRKKNVGFYRALKVLFPMYFIFVYTLALYTYGPLLRGTSYVISLFFLLQFKQPYEIFNFLRVKLYFIVYVKNVFAVVTYMWVRRCIMK